MQKIIGTRHLYVLFVPILFCLIFFGIISLAEKKIESNQLLIQKQNWKNKAEFTISRIRNSFSIASQIQLGIQKTDERLLKQDWTKSKNPEFYLNTSLTRLLPPNSLSKTKVWAFIFKNGKPTLLKHQNFEKRNRRIMEKAFTGLCEIADNWESRDSKILNKYTKLLSGIFGENSAPEFFAGEREGIVTPVNFSGQKAFAIWKSFKKGEKRTGGLIAIFDESYISNVAEGLKNHANSSLAQSRKTFAATFFQSKKISNQFSPILPAEIEKNPEEKYKISKILRKYWQEDKQENIRKIFSEGDYLVYLDYISLKTTYSLAIFSKKIQNKKFSAFKPSSIFLFLPLAWIIFFFSKMFGKSRTIISLSYSFKLLFFLTGTLPVSFMLYMGITQISQNKEIEVNRRIDAALNKIGAINEKYETLVPLLQNLLNQSFEDKIFQSYCQSDSEKDNEKAFKRLLELTKKGNFDLSFLFIMKPGHKSFYKTSRKEYEGIAKPHLDYYVVSANCLHSIIASGTNGYKEIFLSPEQIRHKKAFNQSYFSFPEDVFLTSLERVTSFQFSSSNKSLFYTSFLMDSQKISAYLAVGINLHKITRDFLNEEFLSLNENNKGNFLAIRRNETGNYQTIPAQTQNFARSQKGKRLRSFIQSSMSSNFQLHLINQNEIFLYSPFLKVKQFAAGGVIDISDISQSSDLKMIFLLILIAILGATIYILAASISYLTIEPLMKVSDVFNKITKGDFEANFSYPFKNELGVLAHSMEKMTKGLKERQILGKFVSTTLDESDRFEESFKSATSLNGVVLFSDIRSFTTLSESYPPESIALMLNTHLAEMVEIIINNQGQIEQFIGDAIVAFFPGNRSDCANKAVTAACQMTRRHREIQKERNSSGLFTYEIGIGLDHGLVMAGILSSEQRSEFTILGPARATAEKLESESRHGTTTRIMISKSMREQLNFSPKLREVEKNGSESFFELETLEYPV